MLCKYATMQRIENQNMPLVQASNANTINTVPHGHAKSKYFYYAKDPNGRSQSLPRSKISHFFFFLSLEGGAALVPRMASKVLLGSLLESGRSWGEFIVGGATPGGRGRASRPMFMTLCRLLSGTGLPDRDRIPAPLGSKRPGGAGSGEASALSSCIAAFRSVSLAAHCWAFFQQ
jgi:hypothetical protein